MKMRKVSVGWAALMSGMCVITLGLTAPQARGQGPFPYLAQALSRVAAAGQIMNLTRFDYVPGNSVLGVYLAQGQSQALRLPLQEGVRYVVVAAGDEDVEALRLEARTDSGTVLSRDEDDDRVAVMDFTLSQSGRVDLRLTNHRSQRPGFCAMVILRETAGGGGFTLDELTQALGNSLTLARVAGLVATKFAEGNFCVFGGRLAQGEEGGLYNFSLAPGRYVAVAAGSGRIADVDLTIVRQNRYDDQNGTIVATDTSRERTAICELQAESGQYYYLRHKNYATEGGGSGFAFICLLQR